jgi:NAD(P)-dependent dehydrogenase (short-subunit alcohol dehydrogenase family)
MALAAEGAKVVTNNRKPAAKELETVWLGKAKLASLTPEMQAWVHKEYEFFAGDAETTARAIRDAGGEAAACFADISDFDQAKRLVETCVEKYGTVDIVINVAAVFGQGPVEEISAELWDRVMDVKPTGYFNVIRHAVPYMQAKGWGRIINCSSPAFVGGGNVAYVASNTASVGLTWGLAAELYKKYGITANAFTPAAKTRASVDMEVFIKTELTRKADGSPPLMMTYDNTPFPETFAPFLAWLAGEESQDINGAVFFCSGSTIAEWKNPYMANSIHTEGDWSMEKVREQVPAFFEGYHDITPAK